MDEKKECIVLKNICKSYGNKQVLKDVSITVPYGAIYGLLGPSGCGKSTTVKIVAAISKATSGEAYVLGQPMPQLEMVHKIGYMAQSDALYGDLTANQNLKFFGALYGLKGKALDARIKEVLTLVNLLKDTNKKIDEFSGGMKRRLSLAMALLHKPEVLILDEPTVGIDPVLRKDIWEELYKLTADGITILVTTHVMDEAEKCNQLSMMREGRLIASGTPKQIQESVGASSLEEAFLHYGKENASES
ncbi:ABC transporter ATP-binding protein [Clostridium aminobutyricum]|uniref:ABC transporter ATP-binding protein n=1 Tax=Clostridium aminobutyricum TaxID=33953 RepID=A0A939D9G8_CLOAM|nr:ABC transporter ATP-binding protein [Clostridium aminobutyricum]MBN7773889.1 ABC transporter ATP-binding protein [Clostridium aminobutyricum]